MDIFRADDAALDHHLEVLQRDLDAIVVERMHIAEDLRALQLRYDEVIRLNEGNIRELGYDYRHRKRTMQGRVIYKALERALKINLQGYFLDIKN